MEKFIMGVAIGGLCGALLVANNYKMRALVKKGQDEAQKKLDELLGEKLDEMEQQAKDTVKDVKKFGKTSHFRPFSAPPEAESPPSSKQYISLLVSDMRDIIPKFLPRLH